MSPWASGDSLTPATLNRQTASAISSAMTAGWGVHNVRDYGAANDGSADIISTLSLIESRISAARGGRIVFPPGTYYTAQEIQSRLSHVVWDFGEARIVGPTGGTAAGDLFAVGDRDNPSIAPHHVVVRGGVWEPRHPDDNAMGVLTGRDIRLEQVSVSSSTYARWLRGIFVQTDNNYPSGISGVLIDNCFVSSGGSNGYNIESAGTDLMIRDVVLNNCIDGGTDYALRTAAGSSTFSLSGVVVRGFVARDNLVGLDLNHLQQSSIEAVVQNCRWRGIQCVAVRDTEIRGVLTGASVRSAGDIGLSFTSSSPNPLNARNVVDVVVRRWTTGLYSATSLSELEGLISSCSTAIETYGSPSLDNRYDFHVRDWSTTLVSAEPAGDEFRIASAGTSFVHSDKTFTLRANRYGFGTDLPDARFVFNLPAYAANAPEFRLGDNAANAGGLAAEYRNPGSRLHLLSLTPSDGYLDRLVLTELGQVSAHSSGLGVAPTFTFDSERSLGMYRSANSTLKQSYGTADFSDAQTSVQTVKFQSSATSVGGGTALLGTNSPAGSLSAPVGWIRVGLPDGGIGYIPAWR